MRARALLERLGFAGAAAQGAVPGLYAWGVTVVPVAWGHGAAFVAKVAAVVALGALVAGLVGEQSFGARARVVSFWGFVLATGVVWAAAPAGLGPLRMDASRAMAGMLGWALFALVSAGPAIRTPEADLSAATARPLSSLSGREAGEVGYLTAGAVATAMLQTVGWKVASVERALLVRFVALAAGLAVLGAAADLALARRAPRQARRTSRRLRAALPALMALGVLAIAGVLLLTSD